MPSLKFLKNRIRGVKSTQKITKAMQLISASRLYRAKEELSAAEAYVQELESTVHSISLLSTSSSNKFIANTAPTYSHFVIVITSDRGLCGAFNSTVIKYATNYITSLAKQKKRIKLLCIGKKGHEALKHKMSLYYKDFISEDNISTLEEQFFIKKQDVENIADLEAQLMYIALPKTQIMRTAEYIADQILERFFSNDTDHCCIIYNHFISVIKHETICQQLIPFTPDKSTSMRFLLAQGTKYSIEPHSEAFIQDAIEKNLVSRIYWALLHHIASEHSSRMTAMDHATRNSKEMIKKLSHQYNRTRQAYITNEMIEIISGAQAV